MKQILGAKDLFTLILESWLKDYRGEASEKVRIASKLQPVFAQIKDLRLKQLYLKESAFRLGVDEKWLIQAVSAPKNDNLQNKNVGFSRSLDNSGQGSNSSPKQAVATAFSGQNHMQKSIQSAEDLADLNSDLIDLKGTTQAEQVLLGLVLKSLENFLSFERACSLDDIQHVGLKNVLKRITEVSRQAPEKFDKLVSLLTNLVNKPEILIADQGFDSTSDSSDTQLIQDCVKKIKERRILEKRIQLTQELKKSSPGSDTHQGIMKALMDLKIEELNLKGNSVKIFNEENT